MLQEFALHGKFKGNKKQNSLLGYSVDVQVSFIIDCYPSIQRFDLIRHRSTNRATHPARPSDGQKMDRRMDRQMEAWHGMEGERIRYIHEAKELHTPWLVDSGKQVCQYVM